MGFWLLAGSMRVQGLRLEGCSVYGLGIPTKPESPELEMQLRSAEYTLLRIGGVEGFLDGSEEASRGSGAGRRTAAIEVLWTADECSLCPTMTETTAQIPALGPLHIWGWFMNPLHRQWSSQ